jgi:hypothetical protein
MKMAVFWFVAPSSQVNFYQTTWHNNPEDNQLLDKLVTVTVEESDKRLLEL